MLSETSLLHTKSLKSVFLPDFIIGEILMCTIQAICANADIKNWGKIGKKKIEA